MSTPLEKLQEAVEEFARTEWGIDPQALLVDWILVTYHAGWNEDNDPFSSYGTVYQHETMSDHQAIGLLRMSADRLQYGYNTATSLPRDD